MKPAPEEVGSVASSCRSLRKPVVRPEDAAGRILDRATVLVGGWGGEGVPGVLLTAIADTTVDSLIVVTNNCGMGHQRDVGLLFAAGQVRKAITSFPTHPEAKGFREAMARGGVEVEIVPQGTLVERIRCAGSGLGGFFTPTSAGTPLGEGKEERIIDGRLHVLEQPLRGDIALVHAHRGDRFGNLTYRFATGAFNSTMAMAADLVIAEVDELVDLPIEPDRVDTAGIFVDLLVDLGASDE